MRNLSEYKDEEALDLLAELIEPASEIFADKDVSLSLMNGKKMDAIKSAIKNHKKAVIQIMAILEGVSVEEYHCNVFTLPMQILNVANDEDLMSFFTYAVQNGGVSSFGSASESTTDQNE